MIYKVPYDLAWFFRDMMKYAATLPEEPSFDGWRTFIEAHCEVSPERLDK